MSGKFQKKLSKTRGIDSGSVKDRVDIAASQWAIAEVCLEQGYETAFSHAQGDAALVGYVTTLKDKTKTELRKEIAALQQRSEVFGDWMEKRCIRKASVEIKDVASYNKALEQGPCCGEQYIQFLLTHRQRRHQIEDIAKWS